MPVSPHGADQGETKCGDPVGGKVDTDTQSHHLGAAVVPMSTPPTTSWQPERVPLCQLPAGTSGRVYELTGEGQFKQRIRELGFGESAVVTKVSGQSPVICRINGTRIALSHGAASQILVERFGAVA